MTGRNVHRVSALLLAAVLTASIPAALADPTASAGFAAPDEKAPVAKSTDATKSSGAAELDGMLRGTPVSGRGDACIAPTEGAGTSKPPQPRATTKQLSTPEPMISGVSVYLTGTPKMDLESLKSDQEKTLKGGVSAESTTAGARGILMLPEMDCVGFAAQTSIDGSAQLKGMITHGKPGYNTDGASWMISGDYPVICSVFDGDSCQAQGIEGGDIIVELNGVNCYKLDHDSILSLFRAWDPNMRNHYTLKRGNQLFRVITQITWHPFGSGSYEENLWKSTWSRYKY